jgi:hypothetical protein
MLSGRHAARVREGRERAVSVPFASTAAAPDDRYAWDFYQRFVVDAPRRITTVIEAEYFDPAPLSVDDTAAQVALHTEYEALFDAVVDTVAARYGQLPTTEVDDALFDEELFDFDSVTMACWVRNDRLVVVHYAVQYRGEGRHLSVVLCGVPRQPRREGVPVVGR